MYALNKKDRIKLHELRVNIRENFIIDENTYLQSIQSQLSCLDEDAINQKAATLLEYQPRKSALDIHQLLQTFSLNTDQGKALLELAEALLRIPDTATQDDLIADKVSHLKWTVLIHKNTAWTTKLLCIALEISAFMLRQLNHPVLISSIKKTMKYGIRQCAIAGLKIFATQFVIAKTINKALEKIKNNDVYSFDMLGEAALTHADAQRFHQAYMQAIHSLSDKESKLYQKHSISIKLSALHPRFTIDQREYVLKEIYPKIKTLAVAAKQKNISLTIDAEESWRLELSLDIFTLLMTDEELKDWQGLGFAVQAYQKRAASIIHYLYQLANIQQRQIAIRLVKGAYWDTEIKQAQHSGLNDYPVFTAKRNTDLNYLYCSQILLHYQNTIYTQFASHNAFTLAAILSLNFDHDRFELQRLTGMGEALFRTIKKQAPKNIRSRIYAPVGNQDTLLSYLVRRILENGANTSFVHQLTKADIKRQSISLSQKYQRHCDIPQPKNLYIHQQGEWPERLNSPGTAIDDLLIIDKIIEDIGVIEIKEITKNLTYKLCDTEKSKDQLQITSPINFGTLYFISADSHQTIKNKFKQLQQGQSHWKSVNLRSKKSLFHKLINLLHKNRPELIFIMQYECGKTLADCMAELREAEDFIHYYIQQYELLSSNSIPEPLGTSLCISPWNFPIAIFIGQISAALITGNTVIAKASRNSQWLALFIIKLFYQAGFSESCLQILLTPGKNLDALIKTQRSIQAVIFTGSYNTAKNIQRNLLMRQDYPIAFIAETGGINCMIIDSTALLEQAINDVITSAFLSAGQRCSCLRVLYLQEDIAEVFEQQLILAVKLLHVGDNRKLSTDIGPVIDLNAAQNIRQHISNNRNRLIYPDDSDDKNNDSCFIEPHIFRLEQLFKLKKEVFGPCLHIIHYQREKLDNVISEINNSEYGLTFGIHSRLKHKAEHISNAITAGNIYVNRNIIGATVGMQAFGGCKRSGTGPKAGGPRYIHKLIKSSATDNSPNVNNIKHLSCMQKQINTIETLANVGEISLDEAKTLTTELIQANTVHLTDQEHAHISGEINLFRYQSKEAHLIYIAKTADKLRIIRTLLASDLSTGMAYLFIETDKLKVNLGKLKALCTLNYNTVTTLHALNDVKIQTVLHCSNNQAGEDLKNFISQANNIIAVEQAGSIENLLYSLSYEKLICINQCVTGANMELINIDTL
ncbi:MAG: bifunctional proline dehydrogenase/L-glutamate gamma-semialdehyde dehydrogenase PutA [Pseudomonadales bacterium]|nr:bifunctional proline dehydrogenase/L-glutamate gamma-semialdehyde dehydrogenase PutA [Pseudomonadales bacterium]